MAWYKMIEVLSKPMMRSVSTLRLWARWSKSLPCIWRDEWNLRHAYERDGWSPQQSYWEDMWSPYQDYGHDVWIHHQALTKKLIESSTSVWTRWVKSPSVRMRWVESSPGVWNRAPNIVLRNFVEKQQNSHRKQSCMGVRGVLKLSRDPLPRPM